MATNQHEPEVRRAEEAVTHSEGLRSRLLRELSELERGLQTTKRLAEALPEDEAPPALVSETEVKVRKVWHLWKR